MTIINSGQSRVHPGNGDEESYLAGLRMQYVKGALKNYRERQRRLIGAAIFELQTFHHWTLAEAVLVVGVSLETARKHVRQYRAWLREHYSE